MRCEGRAGMGEGERRGVSDEWEGEMRRVRGVRRGREWRG